MRPLVQATKKGMRLFLFPQPELTSTPNFVVEVIKSGGKKALVLDCHYPEDEVHNSPLSVHESGLFWKAFQFPQLLSASSGRTRRRGREWHFLHQGSELSVHWRIWMEGHKLHTQHRFPGLGECLIRWGTIGLYKGGPSPRRDKKAS